MTSESFNRNELQKSIDNGRDSPDDVHPAQNQGSSRPHRKWIWVVVGVFGMGTLTLIVCCGIGTFFAPQISAAMLQSVKIELNELVDVQTQTGGIEELTMNFGETLKVAQSDTQWIIASAETVNGPRQFSIKLSPSGEIQEVFLLNDEGSRTAIDVDDRIESRAL